MTKRNLRQAGFSLVELMVVVAIIGVLATVAIPRVNRFISKARTTEAQVNLGSIYTFNKNFYVEFGAYNSGFYAIGYLPEGLQRYRTGFTVNPAANADFTAKKNGQTPTQARPGTAGWTNANDVNDNVESCGAGATACNTIYTSAFTGTYGVTANTFSAGAESNLVSTSGLVDTWSIDHNKNLRNVTDGTE